MVLLPTLPVPSRPMVNLPINKREFTTPYSQPAELFLRTLNQVQINVISKLLFSVIISGHLGVSWVDMHLVANRVMLQHLKEYGLLQGDVDDMMKVCSKNCQMSLTLIVFSLNI